MRARTLVVAILIAGCAPAFPDVPEDCRFGELVDRVRVPPPDRTDLLLVVDTHASPDRLRETIAARLAALVRILVSGDRDRDGVAEFDPISDLVITVTTADVACGAPSSIVWRATASEPGDPDALAADVAASIERLPECARSAPIEAMTALVATPAALRAHALVALVIVTDEDEPDAADHAAELAELLDPREHYARLSVLAGFTVRAVDAYDWDLWRADPGCDAPSVDARGAPGLVDAAEALWDRGAATTLASICAEDWSGVIEPVIPSWPLWVPPCHCLPRPLPSVDDRPACTLTEQLGASGYHDRCADLPGRDPTPVDVVDGRERCLVLPSDGVSAGWYAGPPIAWSRCVETCGADAPSIEWIGADPEQGSELELRCVSIAPTPGCDAAP